MKRYFVAVVLGLLGLIGFGGEICAQGLSDACGLMTQTEVSDLFQEAVAAGVERTTVTPAGRSCRYSYTREGDVYGMTLIHCTDASIAEEGIFDSAADVMVRQLRARKNSPTASGMLEIIPNLGEEAFWDGSALWMRQGRHLVRVAPSPHLAGTFADMAAADAAKRERGLALARRAAETILTRLP